MDAVQSRGHFDPAQIATHFAVVPVNFQIQNGFARISKSSAGIGSAQMGLYDASNVNPDLWSLVSSSAVVAIPTPSVVQWFVFPWTSIIPAGTYILGIIINGVGTTGDIYRLIGPNVRMSVAPITPGVLPDPVGAASLSILDWSMYIDWIASAPPTPSAVTDPPVCCCDC